VGVTAPRGCVGVANGFDGASRSPGREAAEAAKGEDSTIDVVGVKVLRAAVREAWTEGTGVAKVEEEAAREAGTGGKTVGVTGSKEPSASAVAKLLVESKEEESSASVERPRGGDRSSRNRAGAGRGTTVGKGNELAAREVKPAQEAVGAEGKAAGTTVETIGEEGKIGGL
jgi:hypothetical protein